MIDIKFLRENPDVVKQNIKNKFQDEKLILVDEVIYNMIITIILYSPIQKFGYYIENEYKGNKILTKYF